MVDEVEQPEERDDGLDNTEDAGGEKAGVSAGDADTLEDSRAVVVDSVDTRAVLPQEQHRTEEETVEDTLVGPGGLERLPEAEADLDPLLLERLLDHADFLHHVDMVGGEVADPRECLNTPVPVALEEEPSRRFPDEEGADDEQTSGDELHCEGDEPLLVAWGEGLVDTVLLLSELNKTLEEREHTLIQKPTTPPSCHPSS